MVSIFSELRTEYRSKYRRFSRMDRSIMSKTYMRLKNGVVIRWRDVSTALRGSRSYSLLGELLVEMPQTSLAKKTINRKLDDIEASSELTVQVIYGEFGQGKTQVSQVVEEWLADSNLFSHLICINHTVNTMEAFIETLCSQLRENLQKKPVISKVELLLKELEELVSARPFQQARSFNLVEQVIKSLSDFGYRLVFIFDEFASLVTREADFTPWGDFFVKIMSSTDLRLLIVLLLPQRTASTMVAVDGRLKRLNTYFGVGAIYLAGKYGELVTRAVAHVLALKAVHSKLEFDDCCLEFAANAIKFRLDELQEMTIRDINTWAVDLGDMMELFSDFDWQKKTTQFQMLDNTDKGTAIEECLRVFLKNAAYPGFKLRNPETEEMEEFQFAYFNENLSSESKWSDGHFKLQKNIHGNLFDEAEIATETKHTDGEHGQNQLHKVKTLAKGHPLVFFSLGTTGDLGELVARWESENPGLYPLKIISIPSELVTPLLIIDPGAKSVSPDRLSLLMTWSRSFVPLLPLLETFIKRLPGRLSDREVSLRALELLQSRGIVTTASRTQVSIISGDSTEIGTGTTPKLDNALSGAIALLCSNVDAIKRDKQIDVLKRDTDKLVKRQFAPAAEEFNRLFPRFIDELLNANMIEKDFRQLKGTRKEIVRKTTSWITGKAHDLLSEKVL